MFLAGHPNHQLVFMRIWQIEPTYLTDAFRDFYEENPLNITRILDVAQDLKVRSCLPPWPSLRTDGFLDTRSASRS
jgi:CCR4-NOT transcription complex subunit 1